MDIFFNQPVHAAVTLLIVWLTLGLIGLALSFTNAARLILNFVFPCGSLISLLIAAVGVWSIMEPSSAAILPGGLPGLPFHVRIDALSGIFLLLLGGVSFGISLFSIGYFQHTESKKLGLLSLQYHIFLASMSFVLIADDAYLFMIAWESMALSSYFLVTTEHHSEQNRKAGFIYLLIAHVGALGVLLCFGILQGGDGDYSFSALRDTGLSSFWNTVAFALAFFGFCAKAGMLPLHVWLPEAHPAAPTPVSALMSGVMLKTAIYGMIRVVYDLIGHIRWEWGVTVLIFGAATSIFGVLFALMQNDLKRLLAYSSVENIGVILIGIGLSMVFIGSGHPLIGTLGLIAALYHSINHAIFKSLLFLGAGSIMHSTGFKNLNEMGGLIRYMPHTAFYFLIGALAISALPPLNGFISEWLIIQTSLQAGLLQDNSSMSSLVPIVAAILLLTGALTAMCFVKLYGIAFLGQHRHEFVDHQPRDTNNWERAGMLWLTAGCFALGLFPVIMIDLLNKVCLSLIGTDLNERVQAENWLWLTPIPMTQASYSPILVLLGIILVLGITVLLIRIIYHKRLRRSDPWDCGFPEQTPRMEDSSDAFGQAVHRIFGAIFKTHRKIPSADDPNPIFSQHVEDRFWYDIYFPITRLVGFLTYHISKLQQGRISVYLLYSFITLIALLVFV